ncbi:uncharacterized protein YbjT (DUF2867 family) [Microbacteriaceae bacterium SG_E_30_P1]|uniref:Uncharacterized protein YbjT (DUF2867 family) n=1 Tax=Antiquaquibacter oligotrophicus TaxID=2880260 RepID=A0ABT6KQ43_9MICO|nr:SDR family oxidoreductase [Antiquaquibacter oligotrophicus]MDH6181984.1 uncharacterized protein YbjT (DUF2867 family) [Antiquaquibacter oligotrophicus]UDF12347.1 SDR family oxidoreductase [Antiquaquibacter oligotrophicus]
MSKIIIIGGHGKVALLLAPILAGRGDDVTAVVRNPDHLEEVAAGGAAPVLADVETLDTDALAELIAGHDAVVWSAGAAGDRTRTYAVDRDTAIRSMDAAAQAGVTRYVMVSYLGARPDHGVPESDPFFRYAEAKAAADAHLRASGLDYTILGPSSLTLEPASGRISVQSERGTVSRGNVAEVIAAVLVEPSTVGKTIEFVDGETPISEAILG